MAGRVEVVLFGPLWQQIRAMGPSKTAQKNIGSNLPSAEEAALRTRIADSHQALIDMINRGSLTESVPTILRRGEMTYPSQLQLLGAVQIDGAPLLKRDWLFGAVGSDSPLVTTLLSNQGKVTATTLNANELINLSAVAKHFGSRLNRVIGRGLPIRTLVCENRFAPIDKGEDPAYFRAMQPYDYSWDDITWHHHIIDPAKAEVFEWAGGLSFIPLDLRDINTLRAYVAAFRGGIKFDGLVLKKNSEIFAHALFEKGKGGRFKPRSDIQNRPELKAMLVKAYETWLARTLRELCQERTRIIVNGSDAIYALPFLLRYGYEILIPGGGSDLAFTLTPESRNIILSPGTAALGGLYLRGSNVAPAVVRGETMSLHYGIYLDLDGSFVVLEGPGGTALPSIPRQLSTDESALISLFVALEQQKALFDHLVKTDPEGKKYYL